MPDIPKLERDLESAKNSLSALEHERDGIDTPTNEADKAALKYLNEVRIPETEKAVNKLTNDLAQAKEEQPVEKSSGDNSSRDGAGGKRSLSEFTGKSAEPEKSEAQKDLSAGKEASGNTEKGNAGNSTENTKGYWQSRIEQERGNTGGDTGNDGGGAKNRERNLPQEQKKERDGDSRSHDR